MRADKPFFKKNLVLLYKKEQSLKNNTTKCTLFTNFIYYL